jgi:hypothetical protein
VRVPPSCELALGEPWLDLLIQARTVGWGVPARSVAVVDVPGLSHCGLLIGGDSFAEWPQVSDSFSGGPSREPGLPRCADAPDDGEIWVPARDGLRRVDVGMETRGTGFSSLRQVRDVQTGKRYWLNAGQTGAMCSQSNQLPDALEWQADAKGPQLVPSRDGLLLDRLLRRQCQRPADGNDVTCPGLDALEAPAQQGEPPRQRLSRGATVSLHDLLDAIGTERRTAYRAALAAHNHAQLRRLLASGIPPWWTADEIQALATADLPVPEKRRRIALLFADARQLSQALNAEDNDLLAKSLGAWLPRQDWGPILRLIGQAPDAWYDVARALRASAASDVACDIDRAQGFLCEGGIKVD